MSTPRKVGSPSDGRSARSRAQGWCPVHRRQRPADGSSPSRARYWTTSRSTLATFVDDGPHALVFAGPTGAPLCRSNFQKHWTAALAEAGGPGVHFHDLRHTGNTLTAQSGATMADLMARMGHASTRAASIYLHTTSRRDSTVADSLNALLPATGGTRAVIGLGPAKAPGPDLGPDLEPWGRAGDGNRTRTVSLGTSLREVACVSDLRH